MRIGPVGDSRGGSSWASEIGDGETDVAGLGVEVEFRGGRPRRPDSGVAVAVFWRLRGRQGGWTRSGCSGTGT